MGLLLRIRHKGLKQTAKMKKTILTTLLIAVTTTLMAQESHYHKGLRSQSENDKYGTVASDPNFNGGGGVYWSRTRNVDDVAITRESPADSIARRENFKRLCQLAYDAYEDGDAIKTVQYGDSALQTRYHTADLYYFMAVSFEKLGSYDEAEWSYRHALGAGYPDALNVYKGFKERQKVRKDEEKRRKKEEKQRRKEESKRLKQQS
jgi:hypothetical protein